MKITLADEQLRYLQEQMDGPKAVPLQTVQPPKAVPMQTDQSCNATTFMVRITNIIVNHLACFIIYKNYILFGTSLLVVLMVFNLGNSLLKRSELTIFKFRRALYKWLYCHCHCHSTIDQTFDSL